MPRSLTLPAFLTYHQTPENPLWRGVRLTDRIAEDRLLKLEKLREAGIDPYPPRVPRPQVSHRRIVPSRSPEATS